MTFTLEALQTVRGQLEAVAPDIQSWDEAHGLYGVVADTVPETALPSLAAKLDLRRPEAASIVEIIVPHMPASAINSIVYRASRSGKLHIIDICWPHIHEPIQDQVLHEAGRHQEDDLLEWVLAQRDFSQEDLEEALLNSVWQGGDPCVNLLLGLVERPGRILNDLRKKGGPDRLLKRLDGAWMKAIGEGRAAPPDGRAMTAKFQADLPGTTRMAMAHRMDKAIPAPEPNPPRPRSRV